MRLVFLAVSKARGPHPPLGIRITPPSPRAGTRRIDQHTVSALYQISQRFFMTRNLRAHFNIGNSRTPQTIKNRCKPPLVMISRKKLPLIAHLCCERQSLAATATTCTSSVGTADETDAQILVTPKSMDDIVELRRAEAVERHMAQ